MGLTSSGVTRVGQRIGLGAGCANGICTDFRGDLSVAEVPHPFAALRGLVHAARNGRSIFMDIRPEHLREIDRGGGRDPKGRSRQRWREERECRQWRERMEGDGPRAVAPGQQKGEKHA